MSFSLAFFRASTDYRVCGSISFMSMVAISLFLNDITMVSSFEEMSMQVTYAFR